MVVRFLTLIALLFAPLTHAGLFDNPATSQFAPVDQAFAFDFQQRQNQLTLHWEVKPGYYLYRQQISIKPHNATLAEWTLPAGKPHNDEFFGPSEIYPKPLTLNLRLNQAGSDATVQVTYQGCAAAGFCYPPETRSVPLSAVSATTADANAANPVTVQAAEPAGSVLSGPVAQPGQLPFSVWWALLIGIGVAFTPCVLPMYPLISGIVLGGKQRLSTARALVLAVVYVQGMALTYTALGLVVAAAGLQFQAALQQPWVLITLAVVFTLLALAMFGAFTFQLPAAIQTRLAISSNHYRGGTLGGVLAMGAIAGLICSPCTTAPLSAILLYIAQSGNLWQGGLTLYLYALGMGLPLIGVTVFGQRLLPKSGPWMESVKVAFGFLILALPIFLLERVAGETWGLRMWSALGLAFCGWGVITAQRANGRLARALQIVLLGAAIIVARPLQDWAFGTTGPAQATHSLAFTRIDSVPMLQQRLAQAQGKPVMLDLFAQWCVACKEFDKYTFSDPAVQHTLKDVVLLQADVTANSPADVALLRHLNVLGLPTILFFDREGNLLPAASVTGFMKPAAFDAHLRQYLQ